MSGTEPSCVSVGSRYFACTLFGAEEQSELCPNCAWGPMRPAERQEHMFTYIISIHIQSHTYTYEDTHSQQERLSVKSCKEAGQLRLSLWCPTFSTLDCSIRGVRTTISVEKRWQGAGASLELCSSRSKWAWKELEGTTERRREGEWIKQKRVAGERNLDTYVLTQPGHQLLPSRRERNSLPCPP
jgi:hypothetical protein